MTLDTRIADELNQLHDKMTAEGALSSRDQLRGYYDTFRKRFGPAALRNLDGEALLNTLHAHDPANRDSLVYWLEFKNDDELPAIFGSIAGGSALKFGIYRRRETGTWMTGSPSKQVELTVAEAVEIARKHRDQLLKGCEVLDTLPANAPDVEYAQLQKQMNTVAPDVSDSAWGHKYFSLLYPEKLDDYHNAEYQRYHLIKLLELPPDIDGRYAVAGRFVALARELNMTLNHMTTVLNRRDGNPHAYWRIGTTLGEDEAYSRWGAMRDGDFVAIGWDKLGDLSWVTYDDASRERLRDLLAKNYEYNAQILGRKVREVLNFTARISDGDLVLTANGMTLLGIGRVVASYTYASGSDIPHRRAVQWLNLDTWQMPDAKVGLRTTVFQVREPVDNLIAIERRIARAGPTKVNAPALPPASPAEPVSPSEPIIPRLDGTRGRIQAILERKGQMIVYGPPGTGKTYWALRTARDLAAYHRFGTAFDQLTAEQSGVVTGGTDGASGLVRMCSFHPAYGYEDFLEGYKPISTDQRLAFEKHDGIFLRLCADASHDPKHRYYLIIDEINRGDIPRIFGELLTVLEKDKRGQSILLPLSGRPFKVPENVYVIGTMNTADRSIALLDTALRRRFGFVELMPDSGLLRDAVVQGIPLGAWLEALNNRIRQHIGRDARNLQVGHAYLFKQGRPIGDFVTLARVVQDDIVPLLEEYCYED
ncbi:MAG: AAA family ATPase [Chloroflexi bacterium]|nr:AAA family ATPase [Chloroflexota bacterium]